MSYAPSTFVQCPDIQAELDAYFQTCDASLLPDPAPLNEFLWSPLNRSGIQQVLTPSSNKIRTLILRYDQRLLESEVEEVSNCTKVCTAQTKRGDLSNQYEIDTCDKLRVSELMNAEDFKNACRDNFAIVNKKMMLMLNALSAAIATKMTNLVVANFGQWATDVEGVTIDGDGDSLLTINTLKTGTSDINPVAAYDVDFAIEQTSFCNGAAIFSGATYNKYAKLMEAGCCSNQGLDLGAIIAQYRKAVMWDRRVQNALDKDHAIAIMPKALQPVYYVSNLDGVAAAAGISVGANYQKQVIYIPGTNIPVDLTLSDDCGDISIIMETVVDLKALPIDMFPPGDYMEGVTWVNKIRVHNT